MSLSKLAYGPDALALVTFDGKELLANDAQTEAPKWRLALPEGIVALHFVGSDALALAVRLQAPIFVAEEVIEESSIEFDQGIEDNEQVVEKFKDFLDDVSPEDFLQDS